MCRGTSVALLNSLLPRCAPLVLAADGKRRLMYSGPARKRLRLLEEAVEAGDGVAVKFADSFAVDNQSLVLLQVCKGRRRPYCYSTRSTIIAE